MNELYEHSAYRGPGWQARTGSMTADIQAGTIWASYASQTEWEPLNAVVLHIPAVTTPPAEDVDAIQHLRPVEYTRLARQLQQLAGLYTRLDVAVVLMDGPAIPDTSPCPLAAYNLMYVRDTFFMTPEGAIIARMASRIRAGEERYITQTLAQHGVPILHTISGQGTFEGADALWLREDVVLVGVGNRTNLAAFQQLQSCLAIQGVTCRAVPLPRKTQHLLGVLQCVDRDLACVRTELVDDELLRILAQQDIQVIPIPESEEVCTHQAMNVVTIAPRKIMMVAHNPDTRRLYEASGLEVVAEAEVEELLGGAGGIGCATGILSRGCSC